MIPVVHLHCVCLQWRQISPKRRAVLEEIQELMSGHFKTLRARLRDTPPPHIPYIGVMQSDLLFQEKVS